VPGETHSVSILLEDVDALAANSKMKSLRATGGQALGNVRIRPFHPDKSRFASAGQQASADSTEPVFKMSRIKIGNAQSAAERLPCYHLAKPSRRGKSNGIDDVCLGPACEPFRPVTNGNR
jgi:hypothetical protein